MMNGKPKSSILPDNLKTAYNEHYKADAVNVEDFKLINH